MLSKTIKTSLLLFCLMLSSAISGCRSEQRTDPQEIPESQEASQDSVSISDTAPEDCLLCGDSTQTLLPLYRGQKNIGIISLNTFDISPIEINHYDDHGNLIKKSADSMSMTTSSQGEDGLFTLIYPNTNRGYANVSITFKADEALDMDKVTANLCQECLNAVIRESWSDTPYGVGLINFDTLEVRLLAENITAFTFGDYYISCDRSEKKAEEDATEMDLLIFYCPERYEKV